MKTIRDLLERDLRKKIVEVIQVDDLAEQSVHDELTEYVATDRIKQHYRTLLQAMRDALDDPHDGIGIWVSGFFGSGKSSFAKNLGYALANLPVLGQPAGDLFAKQVDDQQVTKLLHELRRVPIELIMFDISKATEVRLQNEKIAEVVYRALLRYLDYAIDFDVAELEIELEGEGKLDEFIALCPEVNAGLSWEKAREGARKLNHASAILHRMQPGTFDTPSAWARSLRDKAVVLTVSRVVERIFELMARRRPQSSVLFIIDEVGQYVGHSPEKIEDLRAFVEEMGKVGRDRTRAKLAPAPAWVMITSQEKLEEVVAAIDERRRVSLAKLQDRFRYRADLASADIREVVARRVLAKRSTAEPLLRELFRTSQGQLNAACKLDRSIWRSEVGEDDFVSLYAYLPHHIDLSINLMFGIRLQPGGVRQLGGSCRTLIKQAYELLVSPRTALADRPVGDLFTLDLLYELLEGNLSTEKQRDVVDIATRFHDDPEDGALTVRVGRVLCLLEFVRGIARTTENIAALLVDRVGASSPRDAVGRSLEKLRHAQFARQTAEGWKLLSAQEKAWDTQRRTYLSPRPSDRFSILKEGLQSLFGEGRLSSYRHRDLRSFRVTVLTEADKHSADGDLPLTVCLADTIEALSEKVQQIRNVSRDPDNKNRLYWVAGLTPAVDDLVVQVYASRQTIQHYRDIQAQQRISSEEETLLRDEHKEEKANLDRLVEKLREALEGGTGMFQGKAYEGAELGKRLQEMLPGLFDECIPVLYPNLEMGARSIEKNEAERFLIVPPANLGRLDEVYFGGEKGLNLIVKERSGKYELNPEAEVCREIANYLKHQKEQGQKVTGKELEGRFTGLGYGWDADVIRLVLAVLLRAGKIEVTHQGRRLRNTFEPMLREVFRGTAAFRAAGFALYESIGLRTLTTAVQSLEDLTGDEVDIEEGAIAEAFKEAVRFVLNRLAPVLAKVEALDLPLQHELSEQKTALENITKAPSDECVRLLASEGRSLMQGRDRLRRLERALTDANLNEVRRARAVLHDLVPELPSSEAAESLRALLSAPDLPERFAALAPLANEIEQAYQKTYAAKHEERARRFELALSRVRGGSAGVMKTSALDVLEQRRCGSLELVPGKARCAHCNASLGQMESDLAAADSLELAARRALIEESRPADVAVERVALARFFASPLQSEEALEAGIERLRAALVKSLAAGKVVLPE